MVRETSGSMVDGADIVTTDTDIRIFIESHRTDNPPTV